MSSYVVKFSLALLFAALAFAANYFYLNRHEEVRSFVQLRAPVGPDDGVFDDAHFEELKLVVTDGATPPAVTWDEKYVLSGAPIAREYQKGDMVFLSELVHLRQELRLAAGETAMIIPLDQLRAERRLLRVGAKIGFVVERIGQSQSEPAAAISAPPSAPEVVQVGPYRLVTVGGSAQAEALAELQANEESRRSAETISVAVTLAEDGRLKEQDAALVRALDAGKILTVVYYGEPPGRRMSSKNRSSADDKLASHQ